MWKRVNKGADCNGRGRVGSRSGVIMVTILEVNKSYLNVKLLSQE